VSLPPVPRAGVWAVLGLALLGTAHAGAVRAADTLIGRVRVAGGPEKDTVVWLSAAVAAPAAPRRVILDQRNMTFLPHVLGVPVGTRVEMPNNDRVFHNVFSFKDGKRFDLGLYPVGTSKVVTFDKPGLSRIFCNIHPTMAAYVLAVESSLVAVSDAEGRFEIPGVPPGRYEYHAWRPGAATITGTLTVSPGQAVEVNWP
jgi:plastocyanin